MGIGLTASDVVGTDDDHLALLRDSPVPRAFIAVAGAIVLVAFVVAWPLPAAARTWHWVRGRLDRGEGETEKEENE